MNAATWTEIEAARVPEAALGDLAGLRRLPNLVVQTAGDGTAWLRFPEGHEEALLALRPISGVKFFANRSGSWFPLGARVPTAERPPERAGIPFERFLLPGKTPIRPAAGAYSVKAALRLVRTSECHPATLLECSRDELRHWTDTALTADIELLSAAVCGTRILLRGRVLPPIAGGVRYSGERVYVPLGFRCEPDWPEEWILSAGGVGNSEIMIMAERRNEIIELSAFGALTRAGLRLILRMGAGA